MKLGHENIGLIEAWLDEHNLIAELSDEFIRKVYDEVLEQRYNLHLIESVPKRDRYYKLQYDFVRRDLLKVIYKRNNSSAKGIKAGYVYAIGNPAWGDFVKVGSAIDVNDRLASYQTSSPLRDYYLIDYFCTYDRLETEKSIHEMFDRNSEWCKASAEELKVLFKRLKSENTISVSEDKLYAIKKIKQAEADKAQKIKDNKKAEKQLKRKKFFENEKRRKLKEDRKQKFSDGC